jgi:hypothetical protein
MKEYGSEKGSGKGAGKGYAGEGDARLSSDTGRKVPDGMPEAPGKAGKIPRPE